jgi:hypothetical protein
MILLVLGSDFRAPSTTVHQQLRLPALILRVSFLPYLPPTP